jgi:hypothetical protein
MVSENYETGGDPDAVAVERISKLKIAFHHLLLVAIADVRSASSNPFFDPLPALNSLWAILPPEIRSVLASDYARFEREISSATSRICKKYERFRSGLPSYKRTQLDSRLDLDLRREILSVHRSSVLRFLSEIIRVLDEHGLLREFRREEIGGG